MHFHIATLIVIILQHINRIFTQGIPISPCPKIFQYRFNGAEWFGMLSVRNSELSEVLQIKVTLSMRGKPATNYLGEIELLSRGRLHSDAPVLYKIKFPRTNFPPKLLQVTANNLVICLGQTDHSVFVTQIQLEHTRKFTFIGSDGLSDAPPEQAQFFATLMADEEEDADIGFTGTDTKFSAELSPSAQAEIPKQTAIQSICGKVDLHIRSPSVPTSPLIASKVADDNARIQSLHTSDKLQRLIVESNFGAANSAPSAQVETANDEPGSITLRASVDMLSALLGSAAANNENGTHSGESISSSTILPPTVLTRGAWPWLAAIYVNNLTSLAYQCAGTLVSARVVISSAHCFRLHKQHYTANEVLVFLGRHNLRNWNEEHSLAAPVSDIFIHPDYDALLGTYDADIAVVMLKQQVRFNTYIRPACLWSGANELEYVVGERGLIAGWGISNMYSHSSLVGSRPTTGAVPRIIEAPIVSNEVCFAASAQLRSLTSNRTFCAGSTAAQTARSRLTFGASEERARVGPCTGDSGAGLLLKRSNRWLLRGIVSATLPSKHNKCISNQYVIYADVAKFLDWIMAFTI